jgi:hypothetical protein
MDIATNSNWEKIKSQLIADSVNSSALGTVLDNVRSDIITNDVLTSAGLPQLNPDVKRMIIPIAGIAFNHLAAHKLVGVDASKDKTGSISAMEVKFNPLPDAIPMAEEDEHSRDAIAKSGQIQVAAIRCPFVIKRHTDTYCQLSPVSKYLQEMSNMIHAGVNLENEFMDAGVAELAIHHDMQLLQEISNLVPTADYTFTSKKDDNADLIIDINRASNLIAQRTRRGVGNWAVVSNAALTIIQNDSTKAFLPNTEEENSLGAPFSIRFAGTINGNIKIYVNIYAKDTDPILVGYQGLHTDNGINYIAHNPAKIKSSIDDTVELTGEDAYVFASNAKDYYCKIDMNL